MPRTMPRTRAWTRSDYIREATMGGPGLDGYAFRADTYCRACGEALIREVGRTACPTGEDDPAWTDSEASPQPIFFGESDGIRNCGACGDYMYGECPDCGAPECECGEADVESVLAARDEGFPPGVWDGDPDGDY